MPRARSSAKNNSTANLGFEAKLWLAADKLRTNMDAVFGDDSDTAPRGSALPQNRANPQVVREAQNNFRTAMREAHNPKQGRLTCRVWGDKDDDVRWQWREATWTTNGSPKGEHNQAHQYPSPQRGNANFAWVQHFIHHLAPHGMAGFVLVRFWFWVKLKAARVIEDSDNSAPVSFRERRRETLFIHARKMGKLISTTKRALLRVSCPPLPLPSY